MANSNIDSSQLSDVELSVNASGLIDACSKWNSDVLNADLGSIDISGSFSSLTQNGVGVGYVESLKNALQKSDKLALNISKLVSTTADDQYSADTKAASYSGSNSYASYSGGRKSGGYSAEDSSSAVVASSGASSGAVDTGSYEADNTNSNLEIKQDADTKVAELSNEENVEMVNEFKSIIDGNVFDYLFNTNYSSKIKEQLLSSPKLSDDLKPKIATMDENEIQVLLKDMCISGEAISDFSKIIITIYDNDLRNNFKGATVFDSAKSISDVYSFLAKQSNYQNLLKELYFGTSLIDNVDDNVIVFTRNFVDTLATASNVSYEDILNDEKYKESLLFEVKDLATSFGVMDAANKAGADIASKLYSNIVIKEGNTYGK